MIILIKIPLISNSKLQITQFNLMVFNQTLIKNYNENKLNDVCSPLILKPNLNRQHALH